MSIKPKLPFDATNIGAIAGFVVASVAATLLVRMIAKKFGAPASLTP